MIRSELTFSKDNYQKKFCSFADNVHNKTCSYSFLLPTMNSTDKKETLTPLTVHLRPGDIAVGKQLEQFTGVSIRTHIRSAVAQYMRAHKPIVESPNALGFELETPA